MIEPPASPTRLEVCDVGWGLFWGGIALVGGAAGGLRAWSLTLGVATFAVREDAVVGVTGEALPFVVQRCPRRRPARELPRREPLGDHGAMDAGRDFDEPPGRTGHRDHPHDHRAGHVHHEHAHHEHGHRDHGDHEHGHHDHGGGLWARVRHAITPHSHDANEAIQTAQEASEQGTRAAWIGLAGMMATAIAQVVIVAVSGSVALLADTVHNLGHAATTIPLILAFRIGRRPGNARYPYGYRRAEDLVGLLIGAIILASAGLILWESLDAIVHPRELANLGWVFAAGIVGFLGNEIVAAYRIRAGRRIGSAALIAEGQHARADGLTSIAVVVGVLGVWAGIAWADAVIGLLIGLSILGILVSSMRTVIRRLMDGVDDEGLVARMAATAAATPGVRSVDRVRVRWSGHRMEGDAIIRTDPDLTVRAAHAISEQVEHELLHTTPSLEAMVVHVHPAVPPAEEESLHELSGHHASPAAREAYRARLRSGAA